MELPHATSRGANPAGLPRNLVLLPARNRCVLRTLTILSLITEDIKDDVTDNRHPDRTKIRQLHDLSSPSAPLSGAVFLPYLNKYLFKQGKKRFCRLFTLTKRPASVK